MCLLMVGFKGSVRPSTDEVTNGWESNGHGGGVAWSVGKKVFARRGIASLPEMQYTVGLIPAGSPWLVHMRLASSGGRAMALTHPFAIGGGSDGVLEWSSKTRGVIAHNGHDGDAIEQAMVICAAARRRWPDGEMSDTRALSVVVDILGPSALDQFSGKFAVLLPSGILRCYGKGWIPHGENVWHSNGGATVSAKSPSIIQSYGYKWHQGFDNGGYRDYHLD